MIKEKSVQKIILSKIIGVLVFLVLLAIANALIPSINNANYKAIILFLNNNLLLLVVMSFVFMVGEIFYVTPFPFSLPAPIFSALGATMVAAFLFRIMDLVFGITGSIVFQKFALLRFAVYFLVFALVLVMGYIMIVAKLIKSIFYQKCEKKIKNKLDFEITSQKLFKLKNKSNKNNSKKIKRK